MVKTHPYPPSPKRQPMRLSRSSVAPAPATAQSALTPGAAGSEPPTSAARSRSPRAQSPPYMAAQEKAVFSIDRAALFCRAPSQLRAVIRSIESPTRDLKLRPLTDRTTRFPLPPALEDLHVEASGKW
ncbi:hypothetical protein ACOMHN_062603 [Nucella lapillus]